MEERCSGAAQGNRDVDDSGEDWGDVTSTGIDMHELIESHLTDLFVSAEK
jgi:hypothetical protein